MKIFNLSLALLLTTTACGYVTIAGVQITRDDYPRHDRRLVRQCAKDPASSACGALANSTQMSPSLQMAMFKWMLGYYHLGTDWAPRATFDTMRRYSTFDAYFIMARISPFCVWEVPSDEDVSCEELHQFLLDRDKRQLSMTALSFAQGNCESLKNTYGCHLYLGKHPDEFHKFAEEECNGEMYQPACDEYDLLDPVGAPHQRWTERDREAVREAAREWEAEERRWEAEQREIERQELEEEAEYERRRQERQDAIMDAIEETPQIIQEEMERNQRELDEQIRRQNELFKDLD